MSRCTRLAAAAAALALSSAAGGANAGAASAHVRKISGLARDVPTGMRVLSHAKASASNLSYEGGAVLHSNRTHLIFWQPAGSNLAFEPGYETLIETFLTDVAADSRKPTNVYGLSGQYTDAGGPAAYNSTYGGAVDAADPLPANGCTEPAATGPPGWTVCLTDAQLEDEIQRVVTADHLPTTRRDIYFLVTPNGLGSCTDSSSTSCALGGSASGYCGYHSQTWGDVLYAVIPYNAVPGHCQSGNPRPNSSTADPAASTISHEHSEVVTDPAGDAWIDGSGNENGDLCLTSFGPAVGGSGPTAWNEVINGHHYFLQEEWSNQDGGCAPRDESDPIWFRTSVRRVAGKPVSLTAHATDPDGSIVAYSWFFGDGGHGHRRLAMHAFRHSGVYQVVLRTTDRAGNWSFDVRTIRIRPRGLGASRGS